MKTGDLKALGVSLTVALLLPLAVAGFAVMPASTAAVEALATVESPQQSVLDEDLDVKIFVHQNRPA